LQGAGERPKNHNEVNIMANTTIPKTVEIRLVHRGGYYFYNRLENDLEVIACRSIGADRAREIYDNAEPGRSIVEGEPFSTDGRPWAWSAWVEVGNGSND
jgi:hypothetical protein